MREIIENSVSAHKKTVELFQNNITAIEIIAREFISSLRKGGKIVFMGNGGSCADAQHLAAELVGRFRFNREPLAALALTTNTSIITAIGNDFGFEQVFSRQIKALARPADTVVGISTSGASGNIIKALEEAKIIGAATVGFTGKCKGAMKRMADTLLEVDSVDTPRIQEIHILAGHIICDIVERELCGKDS